MVRDHARAKRRLLVGAIAVVLAVSPAIAIHVLFAPPEPAFRPAPSLVPLERNRAWPAPELALRGPRPLVIAKGIPPDGPIFALYEDGRWFRATEETLTRGTELHYLTGTLSPTEAQRLHARFRSIDLLSLPPYLNLDRAVACGGANMTVCTSRGSDWSCVSVDQILPLRTRAEYEIGAVRDRASPDFTRPDGRTIQPPYYDRPVPEPVLAFNDLVLGIDVSHADTHRGPLPGRRAIEAISDAFFRHCWRERTIPTP
jgi:hypothetical protein